jgi:predicted nucleic acid-binding protein
MKVFFDTSALVTAVVDQLPNHKTALACYMRFVQPRRGGGRSRHLWQETQRRPASCPES